MDDVRRLVHFRRKPNVSLGFRPTMDDVRRPPEAPFEPRRTCCTLQCQGVAVDRCGFKSVAAISEALEFLFGALDLFSGRDLWLIFFGADWILFATDRDISLLRTFLSTARFERMEVY